MEELYDLALELVYTEGLDLLEALDRAQRLLPSLAGYAAEWDQDINVAALIAPDYQTFSASLPL